MTRMHAYSDTHCAWQLGSMCPADPCQPETTHSTTSSQPLSHTHIHSLCPGHAAP